jgi:hypothetical protein
MSASETAIVATQAASLPEVRSMPTRGRLPPSASRTREGTSSAVVPRSRTVSSARAASTWKSCRARRQPPASIAAPSTSRAFPITDPTSVALTTSCSPSESANRAMISSGALPNVTFSSPATPGPECSASCSVASPIRAAAGTTATADVAKTLAAGAPTRSRTRARGTSESR